jgi:hypothetical protein
MLAKTLGWAVVFASGLMGTSALAQASASCGIVGAYAMVYGDVYKTKAPYSAMVKTTHEQKLPDGKTVTQLATTHQARDSAGKTMSEAPSSCMTGSNGQSKPVVRVTIYDPAARTTLLWPVSGQAEKVVRLIHWPEPDPATPSSGTVQRQPTAQMRPRRQRPGVRVEELGSRNIAGVMAEGSRTVQTIPAGAQGNDQPIEKVDEVWVAKDLGLAMLRVSDDPRYGRMTTEVVELNQTEPDAGLFVAPASYKLEEQVVKSATTAGSQ